jgi:peptidoglycan hydrolase-like protein with peptidoglycan-binding domain/TPR repeat protein
VSRSHWAWAKGCGLVGAVVCGVRWLGRRGVLRECLGAERPVRAVSSIPTLTWVAMAVILIAALEPAVALGRSAGRGGRAPLARVAREGSLTAVAGTGRSSRSLAFGSGYADPHGSRAVRALQRRLASLGYAPGPIDGRYGPLTERAVVRFQSTRRLRVDGIAGPRTLAALASAKVVLFPGDGYTSGGSAPVRALQRRLAAAGFSPGPIDGRYGPLTERAVIRFQTARRLRVDGIAGPQTLGRLERAGRRPAPRRPITRPAPRPGPSPAAPPAGSSGRTVPRAKPPAGSSPVPWVILVAGLILATLAALLWPRRRDSDTPPPAAAPEPEADGPGTRPTVAVPVPGAGPGVARDAEGLPDLLGQEFGDVPRERDAHPGAGAFMFGRLFAADGDLAGASDSFWRAHERGHPDAAFELGLLIAQQGDWPGAELAFRAGDERGHPGAALSVGVLAEQRGDLAEAKSAYQRAADRGEPEGWYNLGQLLEREREHQGAISAYARAEQQGHAAAAFNLGVLLLNLGDLAGAEEIFARADERGDRGGACNHGLVLEERGDPVAAKLAYRRAEQRGDAAGAFNLGQLLEQEGDQPGAKAAYQRAAQSGDPGAAYHLGRLLEREGDRQGAIAAYQQADQLGPPDLAQLAHAALRELDPPQHPNQ